VFACVFGSGLLGLYLRERLPAHHLSDDSIGVVKTGNRPDRDHGRASAGAADLVGEKLIRHRKRRAGAKCRHRHPARPRIGEIWRETREIRASLQAELRRRDPDTRVGRCCTIGKTKQTPRRSAVRRTSSAEWTNLLHPTRRSVDLKRAPSSSSIRYPRHAGWRCYRHEAQSRHRCWSSSWRGYPLSSGPSACSLCATGRSWRPWSCVRYRRPEQFFMIQE